MENALCYTGQKKTLCPLCPIAIGLLHPSVSIKHIPEK